MMMNERRAFGTGLRAARLFMVMAGGFSAWPMATSGMPVSLEQAIGDSGSIRFQLETDRALANGAKAELLEIKVLQLPGIASVLVTQSAEACELRWIWAAGIDAENLIVQTPSLPGPEKYFIQYTWNAAAGLLNGYVNGSPLRLPDTVQPPWKVPECKEVNLEAAPFRVTHFSSEARHLSDTEARGMVPEGFSGKHAGLFGALAGERSRSADPALGAILYQSAFDTPESVAGWVMEGEGRKSFETGAMRMESGRADGKGKNGHSVFWCPQEFPESFVAEWDVEMVSNQGLCIVFFAARGSGGEDLFDPQLPKRNGVFNQYTQGEISCYHISYYANMPSAPGRITSNMRKNAGFQLVANGPPGILPGSGGWHAARLIKDGGHVGFQIDGTVIVDFADDGERYGPVLDGGKIGFRQMQGTTALYRNFRVHELTSTGANAAKP